MPTASTAIASACCRRERRFQYMEGLLAAGVYHRATVEAVGTLVVVLLVFAAAVGAIRRDARFDRREILIQSAWIAAYFAGCVGLAFVLVPLGRRIGVAAATIVGIAVMGLGMVLLAKYLGRRLKRRRL